MCSVREAWACRPAEGNPEGYLFPATYPITSDATPQSLLRHMADTAVGRFGADHITAGARRNGVSVYKTAAISPTPGPWLYFVTVAPRETRLTSSYTEQQRNVEEFNRNRRSASGG